MGNVKNLRFIIFGAGAVGGMIGAHLKLAGNNVILIGRPAHMDVIRERGLRFVTPSGTHILKLVAHTNLSQVDLRPNDVVFICVKSQDTERSLRDLYSVKKDVPVFCFQNGVGNEEIVARYFHTVYGVRMKVGSEFVTNGEITVRRDPPGWLVMGRYPSGIDSTLEIVADKMRNAGFRVLVTSNIMPYKWGKLIQNLGNVVETITNTKQEENKLVVEAMRKEARDILTRAGIYWVSNEMLEKQWPEFTKKPTKQLALGAKNSTWQSLNRGQCTIETDFINGEIVRLADNLGIKAPINKKLSEIIYKMVSEQDRPGKYTPSELIHILGLE